MTAPSHRILLTGFGPFGQSTFNPTIGAVESLADRDDVTAAILPVEYRAATRRIRELIRDHHPDAIVSLGLAEPRSTLSVERVAINLAEARIPDNSGYQPQDTALADAPSPAAYFSTLPVKRLVQALADADVPGSLSYTAGTFVCNAVMYAALDETAGTDVLSGFIHVPQALGHETSETTGTPLAQDTINRGVAAALDVLFSTDQVSTNGNFGALQ